jgi:phage shock protein E
MLKQILSTFGIGSPVDYAHLVKGGAVILDVRTKGEYQGGHIPGSINISLADLPKSIPKLKSHKTIITCCASGMRSASAKGILISQGFKDVHNGGGWMSLYQKLNP